MNKNYNYRYPAGYIMIVCLYFWIITIFHNNLYTYSFSLSKASAVRKWLESNGAFIHPKVEVEIIANIGYGLIASDVIFVYNNDT